MAKLYRFGAIVETVRASPASTDTEFGTARRRTDLIRTPAIPVR